MAHVSFSVCYCHNRQVIHLDMCQELVGSYRNSVNFLRQHTVFYYSAALFYITTSRVVKGQSVQILTFCLFIFLFLVVEIKLRLQQARHCTSCLS